VVTWERGSHSVLLDGWNYIHYKDGSEELYNHVTDPYEYHNLAGKKVFRKRINTMKKFIPKDYDFTSVVIPPIENADLIRNRKFE
jgi:hypothetical protein